LPQDAFAENASICRVTPPPQAQNATICVDASVGNPTRVAKPTAAMRKEQQHQSNAGWHATCQSIVQGILRHEKG
jgi:hypothetical protein